MTERVQLYTDGACSGNPGPGGWGVLMLWNDHEKELCEGEFKTTNNRMELMAAIKGLESLKRGMDVDLFTDSIYVRDGITKWIHKWKENGWLTSAKKPVKNADLWKRLEVALSPHRVDWHWIKGHDGNPENDRADELARQGMALYK